MLGDSGFKRVDGDIYYTEPWVTQALLDRIRFRGVVWEPACGRGDMVKVIGAAGYEVVASDIAGDDLGCDSASGVDFLREQHKSSRSFSIVTNPPYRCRDASSQ
jgi:hypothetical protein